uniref:Protein S100-A9 n=2 Tax=Propithecus coquereli TaxID=379532 RepID=A0A2K6FMJ1_PROCO
MAREQSQLERAIETVINTFHQYSVRLEPRDCLSQKEFKQLVQKDLQNFLKKEKRNDKAINHIMEDLDTDMDKQLSFEEFIVLMARLTEASHEEMHRNAPHPDEPGHEHGPGLGEGGQGQGHGHSHGHGHGHSHGPGLGEGGHGHGHSHGHGHGH